MLRGSAVASGVPKVCSLSRTDFVHLVFDGRPEEPYFWRDGCGCTERYLGEKSMAPEVEVSPQDRLTGPVVPTGR